jgi:glyoxylase-like metal-dependent hydrolase (beta-lactamase superfamily II)
MIAQNKFLRRITAFLFLAPVCIGSGVQQGYAQGDNAMDRITVRSAKAGGAVYMLDCENGFGGGNVAASIGPDGILLVDDMYEAITPKLLEALKKISPGDVRMVVNTHFHGDHIQGNSVLSPSATIIAHMNLVKRFINDKPAWVTAKSFPQLLFADSLTIRFNGEDILLFHLPNGHTDTDVFVYFPQSRVIHMGDTFFNGMFPAVYKEGGGDILQMISNLEIILARMPDDVKFVPGHGDMATKAEFGQYVTMLKETTGLAAKAIRSGLTLQQARQQKILAKYDALGSGGAQTTDEYLAMLYKLLAK